MSLWWFYEYDRQFIMWYTEQLFAMPTLHTVEYRYNAVQYSKILHKWLQKLRQDNNDMLHPQKTPHTSPWRASYWKSFANMYHYGTSLYTKSIEYYVAWKFVQYIHHIIKLLKLVIGSVLKQIAPSRHQAIMHLKILPRRPYRSEN